MHDESNFESALQQSTASIQSNPFNDAVPPAANASFASTPKKDAGFRSVLAQNNGNLNAIFGGFNAASNKYEGISDGDSSNVKNPFGGSNNVNKNNKEKNAWNELNALDFSYLRADSLAGENQASIFACMNQNEPMTVKAQPKKEIPADFFNDVAKAAFSELNSTAARQKNHEFFNKFSEFDCVRT